MNEIKILKQFLEYPIWTSHPIFEKFLTIDNAIFREKDRDSKQRFLFIEGKSEKKVVLIAHADTYFDKFYGYDYKKHHVDIQGSNFIGKTDSGERSALGADDRAGCAVLWALKDSGHSILVTDGEERGRISSKWLIQDNQDIAEIINKHQFMIQFDRKNNSDFKCYDVGTSEFRDFIQKKTGYNEPNRTSNTDICTLCEKICGVNLSVGYYDEHSDNEYINYYEWLNTLNIVKKLLKSELPRFELNLDR